MTMLCKVTVFAYAPGLRVFAPHGGTVEEFCPIILLGFRLSLDHIPTVKSCNEVIVLSRVIIVNEN